MLKNSLIVFICSLTIATSTLAQTKNPPVKKETKTTEASKDTDDEKDIFFKEDSFDFGTIEEGTLASHEFEFVNNGTAPIIISNVQASCGCTTPYWTKDPIAPGKKGTIKASFDSNRRPGSFNKSITITSNAKTPVKVLYIKGTVTPKPETAPKLNLNRKTFDLGEIEKGIKMTKKVDFTNQGKSALSILNVASACNCVTYTVAKSSYASGEQGSVELTYTPTQLGATDEVISIATNDEDHPVIQLILKAKVVDHRFQTVVKESTRKSPF